VIDLKKKAERGPLRIKPDLVLLAMPIKPSKPITLNEVDKEKGDRMLSGIIQRAVKASYIVVICSGYIGEGS
jgi:hypothetical protein